MFTLKKITKNSADLKQIKKLYISAFPKEERQPFFVLNFKKNSPCADLLAAYNNGGFVGFCYNVKFNDLVYVFFLAIKEEFRGQSFGTKTLLEIHKRYSGKRIFLAIEEIDKNAENYDERLKRKSFYERNGLRLLNHKMQEATVVYDVMGTADITPKEYELLMDSYLGKPLRKLFKMKLTDI